MKLCVLALRGLGAGHTGPYGNRWIDTPSLNALAAQSTVFDWHLSAHPHLARRVWRTGRHHFAPPADAPDLLALLRQAGVFAELLLGADPAPDDFAEGWDAVRRDGLAAGRERLAELSRRPGPSLLWIESASLRPPWDVAERFTAPYFDTRPLPEDEDDEDDEDGEDDEDEQEDEAGLEGEEEEEPLEPLFAPPVGAVDAEDDLLFEVVQTTYGSAVTQLDAALADLLDGLDDDVGLIVTSDAGQALAERGFIGPVAWAHREIVHVPLLVRLPGRGGSRRVDRLTLSTDLAPTLAALFGVALPSAHGRSLLPLLGPGAGGWREYACFGTEAEWGLWTPAEALLVPTAANAAARLYVRPDDRREANDVALHHVERAESLGRTLRAYAEASSRPGPLAEPGLEAS